ncbi:RNA polymerase sigma factor [Olleya sp. HaHaR_3_96]|uniref:RNA polymerase sigma factor n=1 Tax=Olleya sp. HaHaR_3_96 TaxID=2745560 RepID=UPI001C4FBA52|nr:sigma-70 family RNA polymerase sigma factor [Olleya sp. HaHaR_3_96]QXP58319.1 sigma-70 family RNA polymerase sigma factor [Olleya sp. HaHaR_3_96]
MLKKATDQKSFNQILLETLPKVKKHIKRRLDSVMHKGHFSRGKYKVEDFTDTLFIEVYNNITAFKNVDHFYIWLFKKTNQLLEEAILEEEFDELFITNIDDFSNLEWLAMVEKFSVEADGDLIMTEDLDDVSYHNSKYILNHVFVEDNEQELIKNLDKALEKEKINRHINLLLHNLPDRLQTVFELFTKQSFTLEEIAVILKSNVKEVEQLLNKARKSISRSLFNKFSKETKTN